MRAALIVVVIVVFASACSSDKKKVTPLPTTTTTEATTSTTTSPSSPPTTLLPPPATVPPVTSGGSSNVRVFGFRGPSSPVDCNAQTTIIELSWTTAGAANVALSIDDQPFAHYSNGAHTEMLPLSCDGKSHSYKLTATAPGTSASQSITLQSKAG